MPTVPTNTDPLVKDYFALEYDALKQRSKVLDLLIGQGPVCYIPEIELYVITGAEAVYEVAKRPHTFSSRHVTGLRVSKNYKTGLLNSDPPAHTKRRMVAATAFSKAQLERLKPKIKAFVNEAIDGFIEEGSFDMVSQFSIPLTVKVMLEILGVPHSEFEKFKDWAVIQSIPVGNPDLSLQEKKALILRVIEFDRYLEDLISTPKSRLKGGFIETLLHKNSDGTLELSRREIILLLNQLLTAGVETPAKFLQSIFEILLKQPEAFEQIRKDYSLIPNMLEETLRLIPPTHGMFRTSTEATELLGYAIPKDAMILLMYSSIGRDEKKFECPHQFNIHRKNASSHIAFGTGIHRCLGAQLAKELGRITVEEILKRLDNLKIAPENTFNLYKSYVFRGYNHFILTFDKKERTT